MSKEAPGASSPGGPPRSIELARHKRGVVHGQEVELETSAMYYVRVDLQCRCVVGTTGPLGTTTQAILGFACHALAV